MSKWQTQILQSFIILLWSNCFWVYNLCLRKLYPRGHANAISFPFSLKRNHFSVLLPGREHNFVKYDDTYITDLNTPYDYESVMHYAPFSFNKNASVPTITAKIPAFDDIIGQRLDFSAIDLERLNRMYNCSKSEFNYGKQFIWLYLSQACSPPLLL